MFSVKPSVALRIQMHLFDAEIYIVTCTKKKI